MKKLIMLFMVFFLCSCANMQNNNVSKYAESNIKLAKAGEMKWSDYYKGLYDELSKINSNSKGEYLQLANTMIDASLDYENGKLTKDQFESIQRDAVAKGSMIDERSNAQARAASAQALDNYVRFQQMQRANMPHPVNCNSYRVGNNVNTTCQ